MVLFWQNTQTIYNKTNREQMANTSSTSIFSAGSYTVKEVKDLNFFDLTGAKSHTLGSSSKFYHIELHLPTSPNQTQAQIYTEYGPTGKVQARVNA